MREILERILAIEAEQKRRAENNFLAEYNSGETKHLKQIAFHKCLKKNRWVFGGNRSGKTECGAVETVYMARGNHPYRENRKNTFGWVVSLSTQVQRDVAQAKVLHYLNPSWIADITMLSGKKESPEYGVIDLAPEKDTVRWLCDIHKALDNHRIGRALWSYKEMNFGLAGSHYDTVRKEIFGSESTHPAASYGV